MFLGEFQHTLDSKNRIAVPVKFRASLARGAVITKGLDECLVLYPKARWHQWAEKLSKLPISQSKSRAFLRMVLGSAMEVGLDKQGRIVVPDYLRVYAHLQKNVVIAGLYDRIEIWDAELWKQYTARTERDSGHIAETLAAMGV